MAAEELSELIAFGVLHLATEESRRHAMGLVTYDQVPFLCCFQLGLKVRIASKHVEAGDEEVALGERIGSVGSFHVISDQDVER